MIITSWTRYTAELEKLAIAENTSWMYFAYISDKRKSRVSSDQSRRDAFHRAAAGWRIAFTSGNDASDNWKSRLKVNQQRTVFSR